MNSIEKISKHINMELEKYPFNPGSKDIFLALYEIKIPAYLAWTDIRQRYRRSTLGPFWITISTGVMIACLGFIFGNIFRSSQQVFLPFLSSGLLIWGFMNSTLHDSCNVFISAESIIKQLPLPLFTHILRMVARNFYIFLHNVVILPIVFTIVHAEIGIASILFLPGLCILILNLLWMSLVCGIVCTRFRDLTQIINSILQVFFYATPIIWMPKLMPERAALFVLELNPFYHLLQIVRAPLLNEIPTMTNWLISIGMVSLGWTLSLSLFNKYRKRISYWL